MLSKPDARRNYDLGLPRYFDYENKRSYTYHEVPLKKCVVSKTTISVNLINLFYFSPWDDPFLYKNRDRSQDPFYSRQPYYGFAGVNRVPNKRIAVYCLLIAGFGVLLQIMAIRFVIFRESIEMIFLFMIIVITGILLHLGAVNC